MRKWFDSEVDILLKSWKSNFHIKRQENPRRKSLFYDAIRKDLLKHDYERSVHEIMVKTHTLLKSYRIKKKSILKDGRVGNFPLFFDLIDIEKLELQTESEVDPSAPSDEKSEEIIEEVNDPEEVQIIEGLPNLSSVPESTSQACSIDNQSQRKDEDVPKEVNNPDPPSNDLPTTTKEVLVNFFRSFRQVSHQLKKNDRTLLALLREQNDIFRTQSTLLKKFITQD
ncbi:hypothetical protein HNY73_006684 [Argiope bruennichi]|uniref:Myb/SANT-like DNA-binding domain-containing protein n=2 Tax=Argiope bruennichi TaxID=94029 RepID=A0A8T0FBN5_ARGBR|nr:hypothetical protein HNY73_006684 [Argiope bruennichi]